MEVNEINATYVMLRVGFCELFTSPDHFISHAMFACSRIQVRLALIRHFLEKFPAIIEMDERLEGLVIQEIWLSKSEAENKPTQACTLAKCPGTTVTYQTINKAFLQKG